ELGALACLRVEARLSSHLRALLGEPPGGLPAGAVGLLDVEHTRCDPPAQRGRCQGLGEWLPHRQHRGRMATKQLAGLVDCCLGVVGPVVADENHRNRSVSVVRPAYAAGSCSVIMSPASPSSTCGSSACDPGAGSENY